jgi:hypothetical protein
MDMSSINPLVSLKIAAAGNSRDVDFLDAPASSGCMTANRIVAPSSRGQAKAVWRISTKMAYTCVYARGQDSDHATQGEGLHE